MHGIMMMTGGWWSSSGPATIKPRFQKCHTWRPGITEAVMFFSVRTDLLFPAKFVEQEIHSFTSP